RFLPRRGAPRHAARAGTLTERLPRRRLATRRRHRIRRRAAAPPASGRVPSSSAAGSRNSANVRDMGAFCKPSRKRPFIAPICLVTAQDRCGTVGAQRAESLDTGCLERPQRILGRGENRSCDSSISATVRPCLGAASATEVSPRTMLSTSATRRFAVHRRTSSGTAATAIHPSVAFGPRSSGWRQPGGERCTPQGTFTWRARKYAFSYPSASLRLAVTVRSAKTERRASLSSARLPPLIRIAFLLGRRRNLREQSRVFVRPTDQARRDVQRIRSGAYGCLTRGTAEGNRPQPRIHDWYAIAIREHTEPNPAGRIIRVD